MPNFCGGIRLDGVTLKVINGVICEATADSVNVDDAVSTCGQLWDGALFMVERVNGSPVITLHSASGESVGTVAKTLGNCGVGLDGRFFHVEDGKVVLKDGFVLKVNVTPEVATITVRDVNSEVVSPIAGTTNQFLLTGIGDDYSVMVTKSGYTDKSQTIRNNEDQEITIALTPSGS